MNKPSIKEADSWASNASAPDKARPAQSKIEAGWIFKEKPPFQEFNWCIGLLTSFAAYLNEQGMAEWDNLTSYKTSSFVKVGSNIYVALVDNINKAPASNPSEWSAYQPVKSLRTFTANDTTPSVLGGTTFKTANTAYITITDLEDGVPGQEIAIIVMDQYTTIGSTLSYTALDRLCYNGELLHLTYDGANWHEKGNVIGYNTLDVNSATPAVNRGDLFVTSNTAATTITALYGGRKGQKISIHIGDANTAFAYSLMDSGIETKMAVGDILEFTYTYTGWRQTGGTVGMGKVIMLPERLGIAGWLDGSDTSYHTKSLTSYGVRKGAKAAIIFIEAYNSTATRITVSTKSPDQIDMTNFIEASDVKSASSQGIVAINKDAEIRGKFGQTVDGTVNSYVVGFIF